MDYTSLTRIKRQPPLKRAGKRILVELALAGERLKFGLWGRPDASAAILIVGSARSGTTWLMNVLSSARGIQPIFEPLYPPYSAAVRKLAGWDARDPYIRGRYLRPDGEYPDWAALLGRVLTGQERNYWTDFERTSLFPDRFLIKLIRANLMVGYIARTFQPAIVYTIRHPCAVVRSRLGLRWHAEVADLLAQSELVEDHLAPFADTISREHDQLGAHAVWWAVENLVAGRQLEGRPHFRLLYEEVALRPTETARRLAEWLDLELPRNLDAVTGRISRVTRKKYARLTTTERLGLWQKELPANEQRRILDWSRRLGICDYDGDALPISLRQSLGPGVGEPELQAPT